MPELLIAEGCGLWDLARMTKVVKVWVSGGHLAELLIVFCSPKNAVGHIPSVE